MYDETNAKVDYAAKQLGKAIVPILSRVYRLT